MLTKTQIRALKHFENSHQFIPPPPLNTLPKEHRRTFNITTMRALWSLGYVECQGRYPGAMGGKYKITDAGRVALRGHGNDA